MREVCVVVGALFLGVASGWAFTQVIFVNRADGTPLAGEYRCDRCGRLAFYELHDRIVCSHCAASSPVVRSPLPKEWW